MGAGQPALRGAKGLGGSLGLRVVRGQTLHTRSHGEARPAGGAPGRPSAGGQCESTEGSSSGDRFPVLLEVVLGKEKFCPFPASSGQGQVPGLLRDQVKGRRCVFLEAQESCVLLTWVSGSHKSRVLLPAWPVPSTCYLRPSSRRQLNPPGGSPRALGAQRPGEASSPESSMGMCGAGGVPSPGSPDPEPGCLQVAVEPAG